MNSSGYLSKHRSLTSRTVIGRGRTSRAFTTWNPQLGSRGQSGSLPTSGLGVELMLEYFLRLGLVGLFGADLRTRYL